jgi:hypothetical protein
MAQANSVGEVAAIPDRNQTVIDLGCVCRPHLLRPHTHAEVEERSIARRERPEGTPLAGALALHGVSGDFRKPLGLNP